MNIKNTQECFKTQKVKVNLRKKRENAFQMNYNLKVFMESSKNKIEFSCSIEAINFAKSSTIGQAKKYTNKF